MHPLGLKPMPIHTLATMTWEEVAALPRDRTIALLPVGATEAHGPHLPLHTDVIIADAMVHAASEALVAAGWSCLVLPPLGYTAAAFASDFPGTLSVEPEAVTLTVLGIARSLTAQGFRALVLANAHLDPAHIGALHAAVARASDAGMLPVVYPDVTRKPWALRLTAEFKSGACHAGQYESSVVMAARPELVREGLRVALDGNPASLSTAIRAGLTRFAEAGGPRAYFGFPADASAAEGHATLATLGGIVADAVQAALGAIDPTATP